MSSPKSRRVIPNFSSRMQRDALTFTFVHYPQQSLSDRKNSGANHQARLLFPHAFWGIQAQTVLMVALCHFQILGVLFTQGKLCCRLVKFEERIENSPDLHAAVEIVLQIVIGIISGSKSKICPSKLLNGSWTWDVSCLSFLSEIKVTDLQWLW